MIMFMLLNNWCLLQTIFFTLGFWFLVWEEKMNEPKVDDNENIKILKSINQHANWFQNESDICYIDRDVYDKCFFLANGSIISWLFLRGSERKPIKLLLLIEDNGNINDFCKMAVLLWIFKINNMPLYNMKTDVFEIYLMMR